ncbi:egg peptide speract receptor-like [Mya arenaria]|uniref:egg peptide speract receptor-like n=1 Tax=Mya arenaria TaxID=6604 RepID=UPI0022DEA220|nr:egg peptide speract receptor-like [Mya arenaria]
MLSIRDEVKTISNRVDMLENAMVTHEPSISNQVIEITSYNRVDGTGESGKQIVRDEAKHALKSMVKTMRKAYSNDKKDLHQLKQHVKGQLRELEQKITSHMHNLTSDVQQNINSKYRKKKDIRLANASANGSTGVQGRLEIRHDNKWGTICDDNFQVGHVEEHHVANNVNVVCRMFGFRKCDYVMQAGLGMGSGDIWMDHVECRGEERSFLECSHHGWVIHSCTHYEDVGFSMWN